VGVATVAVAEAGGVAPVHRYTSYEVAVATELQVSVAVVCVAMVDAFNGAVLVAQVGTGTTTAAVVKVLPLVRSQLTAGPLAFLGTTYQLYNEPAIKEDAL